MLFGVSALKGDSLSAPSSTKNHLKIFCFKVEDFFSRGFLAFQGKNTANPDGFASILTQKGRKSAEKKLGSDFIAHPMVIHHFLFDVVEQLGAPEWLFYNSVFDFLQKVFASIFIVLSGVSSNFSHSNIKRGLFTFGVAIVITGVTVTVDMPIIFGVLHLLGLCMLFYGLSQKIWRCLPQLPLMIAFALLSVCSVVLLNIVTIDSEAAWLFGWKSSDFVSYNYFPLFPWFFVFMFGTALGYYIKENKFPSWFYKAKIPFLPAVGRCTMLIYIVHQPLLYGLTMLLKSVIK